MSDLFVGLGMAEVGAIGLYIAVLRFSSGFIFRGLLDLIATPFAVWVTGLVLGLVAAGFDVLLMSISPQTRENLFRR